METTANAPVISTNEEGYLKNYKEWTEQWARDVASKYDIVLTEKHWQIIRWLRQKQEEGVALTIRKVASSGLVDIKQFYQLFPGGPLKISSKVAGIPKPVSCI
jgi:TusE/DsrC/DsvC family sulfur relay protein